MEASDFIFAVDTDGEMLYAAITPEKYFQENGCLYDGEAYDEFIEGVADVSRLEESIFEPNEAMTAAEFEQHLFKCGFVESAALAAFLKKTSEE